MMLGGGMHKHNIHSIIWEDAEVNEGYIAKELASADADGIIIWDLATGQTKGRVQSVKVA
jgi:hypothetical protein